MNKIGLLFAGQGAQTIGMGKDFYENSIHARNIYERAAKVLGYDVKDICFADNDLINITQYTQPCVVTTSIAIYETLTQLTNFKFSAVLGFSLGECSAMFAAKVFDFETLIYLVNKRATYMDEATKQTKGAMAAVIGLNKNVLENICDEVSKKIGFVKIANYNCSNQLVISGLESAVIEVCDEAKKSGAMGTVKLNVSGAFHTPFMKYASDKMYDEISNQPYSSPVMDIYMNYDAQVLGNINDLPVKMAKQIICPVLFEDSIKNMIKDGVDTFIEIGPGTVLRGLVRRIDKTVKIFSVNVFDDISKIII